MTPKWTLFFYMTPPFCFVLFFVFHRSHCGTTFIDSPFNVCRAMEKTIQRFHCTIVKMEISILYHVIVNSQSNHDNLTRCYIKYNE